MVEGNEEFEHMLFFLFTWYEAHLWSTNWYWDPSIGGNKQVERRYMFRVQWFKSLMGSWYFTTVHCSVPDLLWSRIIFVHWQTPCVESWACTFIQFPVLKAEGLSACASRSERVPAHIKGRACVCICLPVSRPRVQRVCACVCTYQKLSVCLRVFARCEGWTCLSMCMQALRAGSVAAYVWACWELRVCLRVLRV
jgi:hypothetical protein